MPLSSRVSTKIRDLTKINETAKYISNRNPRNLERLTIAYKPSGYFLENPGRSFWHKLQVSTTGRYVTAQMVHYKNGTVVQASTSEWAIKKQLNKTKDTTAYINLAKVFVERCLESGLTEMRCDLKPIPNGKIDKFLKTLEEGGLSLTEPERFMPHRPWDTDRPQKPWEVTE